MEHLLTVTEAYEIKGRGVLVLPLIPQEKLQVWLPPVVELRYGDGSSRQVSAEWDIPREASRITPGQYSFVCGLKGMRKAEVPVGTELWVEAEAGSEAL